MQAPSEAQRSHAGFHFSSKNSSFQNLDCAVEYYFEDGARSAEKLRRLLEDSCSWQGKPIKLLEFASGYGCVTRHLRNFLPEAAVVSCDIHPEAIRFIAEELAVGGAVLSSSVPEQLSLPEKYDVIFALSFFSHMPKATWIRWYNALYRA